MTSILPGVSRIKFLEHFPRDLHPKIKRNQRLALSYDEQTQGSNIQEMTTGSGKTAKGITDLRALRAHFGNGIYFYITTNKNLVEQIKILYPEFHVIYGRNEYDCYYYEDPKFKADEIPCSLLDDCPFRVDQETGKTLHPDAERCPYLDAKWTARQSTLVVCTMSFYLFTTLFSDQWGEIKGVVVDEAHQLTDVIRNALSYEITDYHLQGIIDFLKANHLTAAEKSFTEFLTLMKKAVKNHNSNNPLLDDEEIYALVYLLSRIKASSLRNEIKKVLKAKRISEEEREFVKKLEMIIHDLHRYITSFEYSIESDTRKALNYTYAYLRNKTSEKQKVEHALHIKCYHVAPVIKRIFPEGKTFFVSATIGNIEAFRMDTGLQYPFFSHDSEFPTENARIYLPTDLEDLSQKNSSNRSKPKTLRRIAKACRMFADKGIRSLVLVVSDEEREQFLRMANSEKVDVVTYDKTIKPKQAVQLFKNGKGEVLCGTFAQYGEGIDLPNQCAPATFALRPGYPPPNDPKALYEARRFKNNKWVIWNAKAMQCILQARGRNIRSETDRGVTFCMSAQYKKIILRALPKWLKPAYVHSKTFDEAVEDSLQLLSKQ